MERSQGVAKSRWVGDCVGGEAGSAAAAGHPPAVTSSTLAVFGNASYGKTTSSGDSSFHAWPLTATDCTFIPPLRQET